MCLEAQFDTVIVDRPLVLKTILQLFHLLPSRGILSWEFFNCRFDSLVLETQIRLERRGDIPLNKGRCFWALRVEMARGATVFGHEGHWFSGFLTF